MLPGGVSASKEGSIHAGQSQEQQKHTKDTHYDYIDHALIAPIIVGAMVPRANGSILSKTGPMPLTLSTVLVFPIIH